MDIAEYSLLKLGERSHVCAKCDYGANILADIPIDQVCELF